MAVEADSGALGGAEAQTSGVERTGGIGPLARRRTRVLKRAEDLVLGVPLLLVSLPFQALVALAVAVDSRGPVLFRQTRVGRDGRSVVVLKFRTMCVDAEERLRADPELFEEYVVNGFKLPRDRDHRMTRVGRVLRKTSLDELPQLWNVLDGSMSLVGPRPVLPEELVRLYGHQAPLYLTTKPGMTGPWQVSGRCEVGSKGRVQLVSEYVQGWSLRRDVSILLRTIPAVLSGRGAH